MALHWSHLDMDTRTSGGTEGPLTHDISIGPEDAEGEKQDVSRGYAWLAGAIGAAISLGVGELADRLSESLIPLVTGVARVFVDWTPGFIVAESITRIGAIQTTILAVGIIVGSLAVGGYLGTLARKNRAIVPIGFLFFGLVGGFATARSGLTNAGLSWLASLIAAAIGAAVTLGLLDVARKSALAKGSAGVSASNFALDRRTLLYGSAAVSAVALAAAARIGRTSSAEVARDELLDSVVIGNDGQPVVLPDGDFDAIEGLTPRIVSINPDDDFYLIDIAQGRPPEVNPDTWSLTIDGPHVTNPVTYTYQELLDRDLVTTEVTLACVSNPIGGSLVGNAVWTGVPLTELLDEAGIVDPNNPNHQIFSRSVDGFTCGFPVPLAYDGRTTMLALKMNGEPLPISHGFPARLVVAGIYGYVSATKWIEQIQVTDFEGVDGYWIPRGWSKEGPIKTQSRIDTPLSGRTLCPGRMTIAGVAFSPTIGIDQVEVGFTRVLEEEDQQTTEWIRAELAPSESDETWVQWRLEWEGPVGDWFIQCRATDKMGITQGPERVPARPNGAEGFHTIAARVV